MEKEAGEQPDRSMLCGWASELEEIAGLEMVTLCTMIKLATIEAASISEDEREALVRGASKMAQGIKGKIKEVSDDIYKIGWLLPNDPLNGKNKNAEA
jgi:hypothetical protein